MKKLFSLVIVLIVISATMEGKKLNTIYFEKPDTAIVKFAVYSKGVYGNKSDKSAKAKVVLTIYKFTGSQSQLVWKGEINKGFIENYPLAEKPLCKEVSIYNVFEKKETICASYKVIYNTKGLNKSYENGIVLSKDSIANTIVIAI